MLKEKKVYISLFEGGRALENAYVCGFWVTPANVYNSKEEIVLWVSEHVESSPRDFLTGIRDNTGIAFVETPVGQH